MKERKQIDGSQQVDEQLVQTVPPQAQRKEKAHWNSVLRGLMIQRWIAIVGILALGILYLFLSQDLTLGPSWLPLAVEVVLILPFVYAMMRHRHLPHKLIQMLGYILSGVATLALVSSIALLVYTLPHRDPHQSVNLLRDAALLWVSNIIIFGLWFWEIDGGGPLKRHLSGQQAADFLFPQQATGNVGHWAPHFIDYIFVAFTNATAFSPTDTPPLSRQAKTLMMIEAIISFLIVALLAARAVNILGG